MHPAISVRNLGKQYVLSHQPRGRYTTLRDVLASEAKHFIHKLRHPFPVLKNDPSREEFWALKNICFDIQPGDRVGIIGRNGAGKSTLLKLLSRITVPSTGQINIRGRVASLLEVGTGFHPELTGRENIFLNGAILGMNRASIKSNFDNIVAFSEVETFLDTPVKHYSSGMYMRLAFAVAAHLETEILIVDEVLAVGDAQFQKKCLGKMGEMGKDGRTVLFVSHNMNAIEQLCTSALLISHGEIAKQSHDVRSVITEYLFAGTTISSSEWINPGNQFSNPWFKPVRLRLTDAAGNTSFAPVPNNADIWIEIVGEIKQLDPALTVGYAIFSDDGTLLYWTCQTDEGEEFWPQLSVGQNILHTHIPARFLNEGNYRIELISSLHFRSWITEPGKNSPSVLFQIQGGLSDSPYWMIRRPGLLAPVCRWEKIANP